MYVQKDFNRATGVALVVIGAIFVPWTWGLSLLAVTILDFLSYVARRVRTLTKDAQHPHVPFLQDFDTDTALLESAGS